MATKAENFDDDNLAKEEEDYGDDDDDEEGEDDFNPDGVDDDDDDDDDEYDEEYDDEDEEDEINNDNEMSYLDGIISYDPSLNKLYYKGNGFDMESVDTIAYNILDNSCKPPSDNKISIEMVGPCDIVTAGSTFTGRKPTPRKILLSITVADPHDHGTFVTHVKGGKSNKEDDDDDELKKPSLCYQVYGSEIDNPEHGIEFKGGFVPIPNGIEVPLLCQVRSANLSNNTSNVAAVATAAAAPASRTSNNKSGYDDDDNIDDIDEDGIDHNELIALHEEERLSTDALRKRYRSGKRSSIGNATNGYENNNDDNDDDDNNGEAHTRKKSVLEHTKYKSKSNNDDDDDDDIEF